jgi:hypothetical protein
MQTLGRTDTMKLIVRFCNFAKAPKTKCEFNITHIPCNRLNIQYLIQQTAYLSVKKHLSFFDPPPTIFGPYRPSLGRSCNNYNKCCQRCAYMELKYNVIKQNIAKMNKMYINYRYFIFLDNFMLSCRHTPLSLLSSSFSVCVDVNTIMDHSAVHICTCELFTKFILITAK